MNKPHIKKATFVKGVVGEEAILYDGTPQIAFIGRSNVGKSSTLNAVLERNSLVKVGRTPGKTQQINFFDVTTQDNQCFYAVDLPGYGYAKLSKKQRDELDGLIRWYITHPEADTALICLIIDPKAGPTELDKEYMKLLNQHEKNLVILVNKIDKVNQKGMSAIKKELKAYGIEDRQVIYYSAKTKRYLDKLQSYILQGV
ncbi:YihA family ribosome biogenesis GTP-binding protein [Candidatus Campbellbacteria bacterium]|nr:YihA family ribosome biogenesis GTP-binding protein [Candidatus Campbellbacteria bacterium]|tara:strand:+ start:151 stop:750 length:600 start_codon:yes stop_codon:yes gene_type:complete